MKTSEPQDSIISIVTPSLDQGEFIEETIRSVLSQQGKFYIDYIICDGGSSDHSVRFIELYESLLRENCDTVNKAGQTFYISRSKDFRWNQCLGVSYRWVSEKDRGQADAVNKGLQMAIGRIVAYINSDDVYYPGTFRKVLDLDWSKMDFVFGKGMWISAEGQELLCYPTFNPDRYSMYYQCTLCQPTVFLKRETFRRLGGFSLEYDCAFDYEYWLRAIFQDCKFLFLNETLACSRMYGANKSLRGKLRVSDEVRELKSSYYGEKGVRLSRLGLWLRYFTVQRGTDRRVRQLNRILTKQT